LVEGTVFGVGTLGKIASIISVIGAGVAQIPIPSGAVQWNTGMTVSFECCPAIGTINSLTINELMAAGTRYSSQNL